MERMIFLNEFLATLDLHYLNGNRTKHGLKTLLSHCIASNRDLIHQQHMPNSKITTCTRKMYVLYLMLSEKVTSTVTWLLGSHADGGTRVT